MIGISYSRRHCSKNPQATQSQPLSQERTFCVQILSPLLPSGEVNKLKDEIGVKKMVRAESISYQEQFIRCCITHSGDAFGSPGAFRGSKTQGQSQPWRGRPRSCDCHVTCHMTHYLLPGGL